MKSSLVFFLSVWLIWCLIIYAMTFSMMDVPIWDLNTKRINPCAYSFIFIYTFGPCWDNNFPDARLYIQFMFCFLVVFGFVLSIVMILRRKKIKSVYAELLLHQKILLWQLFICDLLLTVGIFGSYIPLKLLGLFP